MLANPVAAQAPNQLGPLRVEVGEEVRAGRTPRIELRLSTVAEHGCSDVGIRANVRRHTDTVVVQANGLVWSGFWCDNAIGPARFTAPLDLAFGRYVLAVNANERTDFFDLQVSNDRIQLRPAMRVPIVTIADTTVFWRAPRYSFALSCGTYKYGPELCDDLGAWIERQRGVSRFFFTSGGRLPYRIRSPTQYEETRYYTYRSDAVLPILRGCFPKIERQVKRAVGIMILLQTQNGELMKAQSTRSFDELHVEPPHRVTDGAESCGSADPSPQRESYNAR